MTTKMAIKSGARWREVEDILLCDGDNSETDESACTTDDSDSEEENHLSHI